MSVTTDRQRHPRLSVGPEHTLQVRVAPKSFIQAPLVNISASGCCARVPWKDAQELDTGVLISHVSIQSHHLPMIRMQARVVWMLGRHSGRSDGYTLMGIEFVGVREEVTSLLNDYVIKRLPALVSP